MTEQTKTLKQRFPKPKREWGELRISRTLRLLPEEWDAVDARCKVLSKKLGYRVGRSQFVRGLMEQDPDSKALMDKVKQAPRSREARLQAISDDIEQVN